MAQVTITKVEFDRFWNEVLGDDWCIDECDIPDGWWDSDTGEPITIGLLELEWQGMSPRQPEPTAWITAKDLRSGLNFFTLLRRWRSNQKTVIVSVEVPVDRREEMLAVAKNLGGRLIG